MAGLRQTVIGLRRWAGYTHRAAACRRFAAQPTLALELLGIELEKRNGPDGPRFSALMSELAGAYGNGRRIVLLLLLSLQPGLLQRGSQAALVMAAAPPAVGLPAPSFPV